MNKLVKSVSKDKLIYEFLKALNGILGLTDRELGLLTKLVELDIEQDSDEDDKDVTSTKNRKRIFKDLNITPDNLSRYLTRFIKKGLLQPSKIIGNYVVNKVLIPEIIKDRV